MDADVFVQEALTDDSGRGIARVSIDVMRRLQLNSGDTIEILGTTGSTLAVVWPGTPQDTGLGIIRLDASTRAESGLTIGGPAKIKKVALQMIRKILVHPEERVRIIGGDEYLKKVLAGRAVHEGQHITLNIPGNRIGFILSRIIPDGRGIVTSGTVLDLYAEPYTAEKREKTPFERVLFSDIPGLSRQAAGICRALCIRLASPGALSDHNIPLPKAAVIRSRRGDLAHLIAMAIAVESGAHFITLTPAGLLTHDPEIFLDVLQEALSNARNYHSCVIFFVEYDRLFSPAVADTPQGNLDIFIQWLDGISEDEHILVLAEVPSRFIVPSILGTPGRIGISIDPFRPDLKERRELLRFYSDGYAFSEDVSLEELAQKCNGLSGDEIHLIVNKAIFFSLGSYLGSLPPSDSGRLSEKNGFTLSYEDFSRALQEIVTGRDVNGE